MKRELKRELKHEVQATLIHHMKSAFYEAVDNNWPQEKVDLMRKEAERVAKLLGYETLGPT
jgi:hypothetical protein